MAGTAAHLRQMEGGCKDTPRLIHVTQINSIGESAAGVKKGSVRVVGQPETTKRDGYSIPKASAIISNPRSFLYASTSMFRNLTFSHVLVLL